MATPIEFHKVRPGHAKSRLVFHHYHLLTEGEKKRLPLTGDTVAVINTTIARYKLAVKRGKKIGALAYRSSIFVRYLVVVDETTASLRAKIDELMKRENEAEKATEAE